MSDKLSEFFDLSGKIACVTGASSGIGRHVARYLCDQGVQVVGIARRAENLEEWRDECSGQADFVAAELNDIGGLGEVAKGVEAIFGPPDILINAAGLNTREKADDVTAENWQRTMDINLGAPFFLAQSFSENMKKKGWGRIVNFASLQTFRAFPGGISYGTSKGGVAQMTRAMAEAWSAHGINANAIGPGFFKTELTAAVFDDEARTARNAEQTCIGRNGELEDLEGPIHFLCSNASNYVTGQILMVDGGFTAK